MSSRALAISGNGMVAAGVSNSANGANEAFRYPLSGSMTGLGDLPPDPPFASFATGANSTGSVLSAYGAVTTLSTLAACWTAMGGLVSIGDLPGGGTTSQGYAVSANSTPTSSIIVGRGRVATGNEAFRWAGNCQTGVGTMTGLGDLPGGAATSQANGVSADGMVVVGTGNSANGTEAFRWTAALGLVGLGDLAGGGFRSEAFGVSANGSAVVGFGQSADSSPFQAFRWVLTNAMTGAGTMTGLGYLPTTGNQNSRANAVSGDGNVVVGFSETAPGQNQAFIWDPVNGMRRLADLVPGLVPAGWTLTDATAVSADGLTVAGYGINPGGQTEGWVLFIPEPATVLLLLAGGMLALRRRGRGGA